MKKLFKKKKRETGVYNSADYKYFVSPECVGQSSAAGITVVRTALRWCYDSTWVVITPHFTVTITRLDCETAECLLDEILTLPFFTKEAIKTLDKKDKIYYD